MNFEAKPELRFTIDSYFAPKVPLSPGRRTTDHPTSGDIGVVRLACLLNSTAKGEARV